VDVAIGANVFKVFGKGITEVILARLILAVFEFNILFPSTPAVCDGSWADVLINQEILFADLVVSDEVAEV
jgi:hypothetical protein